MELLVFLIIATLISISRAQETMDPREMTTEEMESDSEDVILSLDNFGVVFKKWMLKMEGNCNVFIHALVCKM